MNRYQIYFTLVALLPLAALLYAGLRRFRYRRAMVLEFPPAWAQFLHKRLPVYRRLTTTEQEELQALIKHFLYTKTFIGCNGLEITDEIRVVIAAEACLLLLNRPSSRYAGLRWIYVYPTTFIARREQQDSYGVVSQQNNPLLGESWGNGRVVLAWDSVRSGMANFSDGHNVVLHEFAHQLDQEDGSADGAPLLYTRDSYRIWAQVFSREFEQLQRAVSRGQESLIDSYGATNPAEFFAVVTEVFYERPHELYAQSPDLFDALQDYYRVDPRRWKQGRA